MFTLVLYGAALLFLFLSWRKSREKTSAALRKAWKSCVGVLPLFFFIARIIFWQFLFPRIRSPK